ncbi:hypothetical protein Agau_P200527 (plasmid) [Agrobacterium tumefaciens F2]|nr:hypothetical protein Agau_P200527 [Agrobacterium tumefaciens F2]
MKRPAAGSDRSKNEGQAGTGSESNGLRGPLAKHGPVLANPAAITT